jgi:hypothetical protein
MPEVQATGRWVVAFGNAVYQAIHSSWSKGSTLFLPVEVSILPLLFLSVQYSGRDQILVMPPWRLATTTALPSMLTEVREGLPCWSGLV